MFWYSLEKWGKNLFDLGIFTAFKNKVNDMKLSDKNSYIFIFCLGPLAKDLGITLVVVLVLSICLISSLKEI